MSFEMLIIAGHGAGDVGAVGNGYKEYLKTRELARLLKEAFKPYGDAYIYNMDRNAYRDVKNGNFKIAKYDYILELHFNAFNKSAHGTEIFVRPDEKGITVEQEIMKRMKKYFTLRDNDNIFDGVKRERFLVIGEVKRRGMSGALLETCFIDNKKNMDTYESKKKDIAKDIAKGIAVGFGLTEKETGKTETPTKPSKPVTPSTKFKAGDKVILSKNATTYQGAHKGVKIPSMYKGKKYTVQKVSSSGKELLLKELVSWVYAKECTKSSSGTSTGSSSVIKVGDYVQPKINYDYNGTKLISSVTKNKYKVIEVSGDRVVLGSGLNTAFRKSDLKKL